VTRHPRMGLQSNLAVAVGEPVETRAAKRKIRPGRLLSGNRQVNGRELVDSYRRIADHRGTVKFLRPCMALLLRSLEDFTSLASRVGINGGSELPMQAAHKQPR